VTTVDVRCPVDPRTLFMRIAVDPDVTIEQPGNVIVVACRTCRRASARQAQEQASLVLHRFNVLGEFLGTEVQR
jgi:hypothetical protein